MWVLYTDNAKRAVYDAQVCAESHKHTRVDTEHLLVGLLSNEACTAYRVLRYIGYVPEVIRRSAESRLTSHTNEVNQEISLTAASKIVVDTAYQVGRSLKDKHIGTEHLLLGLFADALKQVGFRRRSKRYESVASAILAEHGITFASVHLAVPLVRGDRLLRPADASPENELLRPVTTTSAAERSTLLKPSAPEISG